MSPLQVTELELQTYTKEPIEVLGKCDVLVEYESQSVKTANTEVQKVLSKYSEAFKAKLGTFLHHQVTLRLKHGAAPRYFRPRAIPFALKKGVEEELQKLEQQGVLESVVSSDWAAPIVVVPKKDGSIRICGDYKVTLNPVLDIDMYPLPKPQELFASLAGGQKFTKLDLSQAYQQLQLDPKSREMVTINTHKGLYRYNHLPFGVASALAVFQRTMDHILRGIPQVLCYLDDNLITGRNDAEHLCNLELVLHRLEDVTWEWTEHCAQAFAEAKASLTSNNVLIHFDPALPISLATDASTYGIGAVVSHTMPDGRERPVAFASRTMTATEKNYSQLEKEALAIVFGVKKFHQNLYGR
uniref:Reverse transcriptase domain-containing protein n=1 Tax=Amphimedon queenslandica TaxID=400682 RepID=A0A1X7VNS7_AMPQE